MTPESQNSGARRVLYICSVNTFPNWIISKLFWNCHQYLIQLPRHNRVQLIWVPGHEGIVGNEAADQLTKLRSEHPSIGPELACGNSMRVSKKAVTDWTETIGNTGIP
jgi:hypothetical protein